MRDRASSPAATSPEYHPPSGGPRRLHAQAADAGRFPRRAKRPVGGRGGIGAVFRPAGCEDALDLGELGLPFHRVAARSPRQLASRLSVFGSQLRRRRCRGACAPAATMPPMPLRKSSRAAPVRSRADGLGSHRCRRRAGGLSARRATALSRWADRQRPVKSKAAFRGPALPICRASCRRRSGPRSSGVLLAFLLARLRVSAALRTFPLSCFDPRSPDIRVSHRTHNFDWPHAELIQVNREPVVTRSRGAGGTPMRRYSPAEGVPALLASSSNSRRSRFIVSSASLT